MPFGMIKVPATFMQTMNNMFKYMLDRGLVCFLDVGFVYSNIISLYKSIGYSKCIRDAVNISFIVILINDSYCRNKLLV